MQKRSKTDHKNSQMKNLQHFSKYFDCRDEHNQIDLLGKSLFKPIPYSSCIKYNIQQKLPEQKLFRESLFHLIEKES